MPKNHNVLNANDPLGSSPTEVLKGNSSDFSFTPYKPSTAAAAHKETHRSTMQGQDISDLPGAGSAERESIETAGDVSQDSPRRGLRGHLQQDMDYTVDAMNRMGEVLGGDQATKAAGGTPSGKSTWQGTKEVAGDYLEGMGRGSKALGAAKIGGYMVGASMLVDMLNPFDDD